MKLRRSFQFLSPVGAFFAGQLAHPRGWFGRVVMTQLLNRGNRELIAATLGQLSLTEQTRLLDVGFGGGVSLELAVRRGVRSLTGVDPSRAAVERLRDRPTGPLRYANLRLLEGTVEELPLETGSVDAALSTNTVYFWPDLDRAFRELFRVLVAGGQMAIGFSSSAKLRLLAPVTRHGFLFHEDGEILARAEAAGFSHAHVIELHGKQTEGDRVLVGVRRE